MIDFSQCNKFLNKNIFEVPMNLKKHAMYLKLPVILGISLNAYSASIPNTCLDSIAEIISRGRAESARPSDKLLANNAKNELIQRILGDDYLDLKEEQRLLNEEIDVFMYENPTILIHQFTPKNFPYEALAYRISFFNKLPELLLIKNMNEIIDDEMLFNKIGRYRAYKDELNIFIARNNNEDIGLSYTSQKEYIQKMFVKYFLSKKRTFPEYLTFITHLNNILNYRDKELEENLITYKLRSLEKLENDISSEIANAIEKFIEEPKSPEFRNEVISKLFECIISKYKKDMAKYSYIERTSSTFEFIGEVINTMNNIHLVDMKNYKELLINMLDKLFSDPEVSGERSIALIRMSLLYLTKNVDIETREQIISKYLNEAFEKINIGDENNEAFSLLRKAMLEKLISEKYFIDLITKYNFVKILDDQNFFNKLEINEYLIDQ